MPRFTRLIALLSCVVIVLGIGAVALRSLPFLPEVAARQLAADLESASFSSKVWIDSDSRDRYLEIISSLDDAEIETQSVKVVNIVGGDNVSPITFEWTWSSGGSVWSYQTQAELVRQGALWRVDFAADLVHPELDPGQVLETRTTIGERGRILGSDDEVLVKEGAVIDVGLQPSRLDENSENTYEKLSKVLDVDAEALRDRVTVAQPDAFVPVITLREDDYKRVKAEIYSLAGTVFRESSQPLSRTKGFASATIGSVGVATPEELDADPGELAPESKVGKSGIQSAFEKTLRPGRGLDVVAGGDGAESGGDLLYSFGARTGRDVRTTLDVAVQTAADDAARTAEKPAAIVALRPSDGHVLAAANHDPEGAGWDRALLGQYPPGSVFKIASGAAMLSDGIDPSTVLDCPKTTSVHGKSFKNAEDHVLGPVPFEVSFAESCNTAFVNSSADVTSADVSSVATALGMRSANIGIDSYIADVPVVNDPVEHAASMIGQGKILASPLGVATMTASVAAGRTVDPILILSGEREESSAQELDADHLDAVREMMRATVTEGTAHALVGIPGEPIFGKTGTAEYGTEVPPRTHSWFAGYQGDVAVAVLVEDGGFGAEAAVPVAKRFFQELNS